MPPTIIVENLTKTYQVHKKSPGLSGSLKGLFHREYEEVQAVKDVSFLIDSGELVGFIGPNGAGKTTTLKMLSGLLYPTSGRVRVLGYDPWVRDYSFLRRISLVMGQKNQLWWDLPASESFSLTKEIYGIPDALYRKNLRSLVEMLDLGEVLNVQVRKLSLGQRMKAELVAALLHSPQVLFLDEPTIGLDVVMQQTMRDFIKNYNEEFGGSIILTSHYMEDVKELCKRVIIIDQGRLIYDGLLGEVIAKFSRHKIIEVVRKDGKREEFMVLRSQVPKRAGKILQENNVADINIKELAIEEVIRSVFTKST